MNVVAAGQRAGRTLLDAVYDNPVITREFRTRMRGWKAFAIMGGYVLLLAAVLVIALWSMWQTYAYRGAYQIVNKNIGQELFLSLTITQAVLLTLIIPSLSAGSITHEIERKTIEMLALTRLTAGKVVLGKQLSGFLYTLILLGSSIPLAGLCLMFGGISPAEVAISYLILISWSFMFTSAGVFWSSLCNKTAAATLWSYGTCVGYMLFTTILAVIDSDFLRYSGSNGGFIFAGINPGYAPMAAMRTAKVCGMDVSIALAAIVLEFALGLLMILVASTHVKHHRVERAASIRVLYLATTAAAMWLIAGNFLSLLRLSLQATKDVLIISATIVLAVAALSSAAFATGEIRKKDDDSVLSYALSPGKAFRSDLGGAMTFLFLWTGLTYAVLGLTMLWSSHALHQKLNWAFWSGYFEVGCAVLAMVVGVSCVGILASSLVKQRKNAAALVLLFVIVMFAGYGIMLIGYNNGMPDSYAFKWQLAALWPMTPIIASTVEWDQFMPRLTYKGSEWIVTSALYLAIGFFALLIAGASHAKGGGIREEHT